MTAQIEEQLLLDGQKNSKCNEPLGVYFSLTGNGSVFERVGSALRRNYVGKWEICSFRVSAVFNQTLGTFSRHMSLADMY